MPCLPPDHPRVRRRRFFQRNETKLVWAGIAAALMLATLLFVMPAHAQDRQPETVQEWFGAVINKLGDAGQSIANMTELDEGNRQFREEAAAVRRDNLDEYQKLARDADAPQFCWGQAFPTAQDECKEAINAYLELLQFELDAVKERVAFFWNQK